MIVHKNKINTGPFCAALQPGDGVTGLWARVTCPRCLAKRPTPHQRRNHIPSRDHGTHISALCGGSTNTIEECLGGVGVCKKCRKAFMKTPEQIKQYSDALSNWGKSFNFSDKEFLPCPTHPEIQVPKGRACRTCVSISDAAIRADP